MARILANQDNAPTPDADYPYSKIKDNTGVNDGTPVNEAVYGDIHQFFAKMVAESGITLNDLPDNETNGFQLYNALRGVYQDVAFEANYQNFYSSQRLIYARVGGLVKVKGATIQTVSNIVGSLPQDSIIFTLSSGAVPVPSGTLKVPVIYTLSEINNITDIGYLTINLSKQAEFRYKGSIADSSLQIIVPDFSYTI